MRGTRKRRRLPTFNEAFEIVFWGVLVPYVLWRIVQFENYFALALSVFGVAWCIHDDYKKYKVKREKEENERLLNLPESPPQ